MPWYPGAVKRPISGGTDGPMREYLGAVLHVNESTGNLFNWVNGGAHNMSCHFEIYQDGTVEQYIDTADDSWCQMDGNEAYISIETEGYATAGLTIQQVNAIGRLYRWLHDTHGIPFQLAEQPGQRGFGWHGMGGVAWGGHTGCPGDSRKSQRATIIQLAQKLETPTTPEEEPMYKILWDGNDAHPAYACAPGHMVALTGPNAIATAQALKTNGLCDGAVHNVGPQQLALLKSVFTG